MIKSNAKILSRNLPSLNALRVFESAARHLSFTIAGKELHITQSAVSRQVKCLEDELGVNLFLRHHRSITLTEKGETLLQISKPLFDQLSDGMKKLGENTSELRIKVQPTFTNKWLIPRIEDFQKTHSKICVRLTTGSKNIDFHVEDYDMAVTIGSIDDDNIVQHLIFPESLTPVCSPKFIEGDTPLKSFEDIQYYPLLHTESSQKDWYNWIYQKGIENVSLKRHHFFELEMSAIQAAISGLGIALVNRHFIKDDLKIGILIEPFDTPPLLNESYYLVYPKSIMDRKSIILFKDWLVAQAQL